jgi:DNA-binding CsgD family transcriptional regulator
MQIVLLPSEPADGAGSRATGADSALSPRERDVLDLLVQGWRARQIARKLCVSLEAVGSHRATINRKLGGLSLAQLLHFAGDNGLLRVPPTARVLDTEVKA